MATPPAPTAPLHKASCKQAKRPCTRASNASPTAMRSSRDPRPPAQDSSGSWGRDHHHHQEEEEEEEEEEQQQQEEEQQEQQQQQEEMKERALGACGAASIDSAPRSRSTDTRRPSQPTACPPTTATRVPTDAAAAKRRATRSEGPRTHAPPIAPCGSPGSCARPAPPGDAPPPPPPPGPAPPPPPPGPAPPGAPGSALSSAAASSRSTSNGAGPRVRNGPGRSGARAGGGGGGEPWRSRKRSCPETTVQSSPWRGPARAP
jgi:hypothetical protein